MNDRMDDRLKLSASRAKAALTGRPTPSLPMGGPAGKLPPQALELEEAVLGALMLEKDALTTVIDILRPQSFYKEAHQKIFSAIVGLFDKSEPVDILTVVTELRERGELEFVGGPYYVS